MTAPITSKAQWRARVGRIHPGVVLLVLVSYVPLLLTRPGMVGADTKTYLYLDPGRLLSRAPFMWDPNVGMGTITHQNIGYLWPMGPYYFVMETLGFPDWVAQRLWLGSIILAAGLGVRWMLRELRWDGTGATVAAFAYALSPYLLNYSARISVILLPFAGLPWLIGLSSRALRRQDWRTPAVFALVTLTVGGVNATSLVLVMVGPLMWFAYATFVTREVALADTLRAGLRITVLTGITSLWWLSGLALQGAYGIPILRYTETYETVAAAALAPELMRGLGYWFFYGRDGLGAWTASTIPLIESLRALAISYLLPALGLLAALLTRWRHRVFFAGIVVAGLVLSIGSHPWDSPSPYGALFKAWSTSDLGLSFRSTPRAVPLIALGLSVFLGSGVAALVRWRPRWHLPVTGVLLLLICVNQGALFRGEMVDRYLMREEQLPQYRVDAAEAVDAGDAETRVLEFPGIDFASHRWGNTVDPVTPGMIDREYVARELIPYGTPPSANLLNDMDQPFQAGRADPDTLAPLARLMGVGDIMLRADLQFERYLSPRPRQSYQQLLGAAGLGEPQRFGEPVPNEAVAELPLDDELSFATPLGAVDPPPVSVFPVEDPRAILRTVDAAAPVVMEGDASGIVSLASSGGLQVDRPLFYAASFARQPDELQSILAQPESSLVITDSNRRQARRWGSVRENDGYTERVGEERLEPDLRDNRLEIFPDETDDDRTVVEQLGPATLAASDYGNGVTYTAGDRAVNAMDGDPTTAWRVAAFDQAEGNYLLIDLDEPVTTDRLQLLQVQGGKNRWMTAIELRFDDEHPVVIELGDESRVPAGQQLTFPERTFSKLRVTIEETNLGLLPSYKGISDVGIAELTIPGVDPVIEIVRPPISLLAGLGDGSLDHPLTYLFSRRAPNPGDVIVADEEPELRRWLIGPVERTFTPFGHARIAARTADADIDALLGLPDAESGGVTATSSMRLPGTLSSRASSAVDGDPTTAYRTPINMPTGLWVEYSYPGPVTVDDLDLTVITDGRHSVPTRVTVSVDGAPGTSVELEPTPAGLGDGQSRGTTTVLTAPTGPLTGSTFRISIDEVIEAESKDWFGGRRTVMPVGLAEIGLPTVALPSADTPFESECRADLVRIEDDALSLRLVGTVGRAAAGDALRLESCDDGVEVAAGQLLITSTRGTESGIDVELLALASAAGGGAGVDTLLEAPDDGPSPPATETDRTGRLSYDVVVTAAQEPYWVVLGQSLSPGWRAVTSDGTDLGEPTLINGFANGWYVDPGEVGRDVTVGLEWTPQRIVWAGLGASAVGVLICIALMLRRPRRREESADDMINSDDVTETDMRPVAASPFAVDGPPLELRRAALISSAVTLVSIVFGGVVVGLAVGALTLVALAVPRGQVVNRIACMGLFGASAAFILVEQYRNRYLVDFNWPERFETTHAWVVVAVFLVLVQVLVDGLRRRRAGPG